MKKKHDTIGKLKKYDTNCYKKFNKKKKILKTFVLLENNQQALQCLVKRKNTDRISLAEM